MTPFRIAAAIFFLCFLFSFENTSTVPVIPTEVGIQTPVCVLDSRFRGNDILSFLGLPLIRVSPAIAQEPPTAKSLLDEGIGLFKQGKFKQAVPLLKDASTLDPDNHLSFYYLGFSHFRLGTMDLAKKALERSVKLKPDFAPAHMGLGVLYEVEGNFELAKEQFEAIITYGKEEEELKPAREMLGRVKQKLSVGHIKEAQRLEKEGKTEEAIRELAIAMELTPENAAIPFSIGTLYLFTKRHKDALTMYLRARDLAPLDPAVHMRLAELYFTSASFKEAIEEFNEVIKLAPGKDIAEEAKEKSKEVEIRLAARGEFEEAAKALKEERLDDALAATQKILAREPRNSFVFFNLGVIYNKKKMYEEAITALKRAIELSPKYVEAHYQLGVVHENLGQYDEAIKSYETAAGVGREDVEETKKSAERVQLLKEVVAQTETLGRVKLLTEAGDLDGALREAEKLMAMREDEEILFTVGKIYVLRKEFDKAVDTLNRVIKLDPQNWEAYLFLAQGYAGKKLYNEARIAYSKVVSNVPETETGKKSQVLLKELEVKIHFEKAGEYKSKGDVEGALRETEAILEMSTDDPIALYNAGVLYYMLEKYEKAEEILRRSVEKSPGYVPAHLQIALVYESLGRYEEASAAFNKVLSLAKEGREVDIAKSRLGLIKGEAAFSARLKKTYQLIQAGKYELALEEAKTVVTIAPGNYVAHYTVGFIYDRLNKTDEAMAAFLKSIEINPGYAKSHFGLARVYEKEGLYDEARESYRKVTATGAGTREGEMAVINLQRLRKWHLGASIVNSVNSVTAKKQNTTGTSSSQRLSLSYDVYKRLRRGFNVDARITNTIYYESQATSLGYEGNVTWTDLISGNNTYSLSRGYTYNVFESMPNYETQRFSLKTSFRPTRIPTSLNLGYDYSDTTSFINKVRDVGTHTISLSLSQKVLEWDRIGTNYSFVSYQNKDPIGNNFAYRSNNLSLNYEKRLWPGFYINGRYNVKWIAYSNPDSTTFFTRLRRNFSQGGGLDLTYKLSDKGSLALRGDSAWERTNLPSLKEEDLVELSEKLTNPIPRVGGWERVQTITAYADLSYQLSEKVQLFLRVGHGQGITVPEEAGSYRKLEAFFSLSTGF